MKFLPVLAASVAGFIFLIGPLHAQTTVVLNPVKDNTLYQSATGHLSNGAGDGLFTGKTNNNLIRRALLKFDVAGNVPPDATITSVTLTLNVNKTPIGAAPTTLSLHTLTADWGEGASNAAGQEGGGAAAQSGDATWLHSFYQSSTWANPGGDFGSTASSGTSVPGNGTYTWSSAQMVSDVQSWLDNSYLNHGWIVIGSETSTKTARRIVSRESPSTSARPALSITYSVEAPACVEPEVTSLEVSSPAICAGGSVTLTTTGELNDATEWHLYAGSCGEIFIASNTTGIFEVSPVQTTTYYVRAEGACATESNCASGSVTVTEGDDATFAYGKTSFCVLDTDPFPAISGTAGGSFSSTPAGLSINSATGQIDVSASTAGISYTITYTTPGPECPSSSEVSLSILTVYTEDVSRSICSGTSFIFGSQTLMEAGEFSEVFQSKSGCDSTVTLNLAISPIYNTTSSASICSGESFTFGSLTLSEGGEYDETFQSVHGCDSTVVLSLSVLPVHNNAAEASICDGSSLAFGSQTLTEAGEFSEVFQAKNGCDSTVTLSLKVLPVYHSTVTASVCSGSSYSFDTLSLSEAGEYSEVFQSVLGCDSTVVLTLSIDAPDASVIQTGSTLTAATSGAEFQWIDCDNGNILISGETDQSFSPVTDGTYAVIVTENGCQAQSDCFSVVVSGTKESRFRSEISLYPNPARDVVEIDLGKKYDYVVIEVADLLGRKVGNSVFSNSQEISVPLQTYDPGTYLLNIYASGERTTLRFIVE